MKPRNHSDRSDSTATDHPYRLDGYPPLPFADDDNNDRGDLVWAVIEHGRPKEDPQVDRVFYDEPAARHHAARIREEEHLPATVHQTRIE